VGAVIQRAWRRSRLHQILTLNGYVAFNLPRFVTALGSALLLTVAAVHTYVLATTEPLPAYFVAYAAIVIAGCVCTVVAIGPAFKHALPQHGWRLGGLICVGYIGLYLATRAVGLPALAGLTARWDFAPGTLALACAGGFIALHLSVLLGINVAYPQRQDWRD
jgi:ABC-type dipeptide/oligopeptide/nickel transport system permease component